MEERVFIDLEFFQTQFEKYPDVIDYTFAQNTHSCHFPVDCEYLPICFLEEPFSGNRVSPEVQENPVGSGYYSYRIPHHIPEEIQKRELIQIRTKKES